MRVSCLCSWCLPHKEAYLISSERSRGGVWGIVAIPPYAYSGHKLELRGLLPRQPGEVVEQGVLVGKQDRVPARLIMICLSDEVTKKRREKIEKEAKDDGRTASSEQLELARWLLLLTTVPRKLLSFSHIVVIVRLRGPIEMVQCYLQVFVGLGYRLHVFGEEDVYQMVKENELFSENAGTSGGSQPRCQVTIVTAFPLVTLTAMIAPS